MFRGQIRATPDGASRVRPATLRGTNFPLSVANLCLKISRTISVCWLRTHILPSPTQLAGSKHFLPECKSTTSSRSTRNPQPFGSEENWFVLNYAIQKLFKAEWRCKSLKIIQKRSKDIRNVKKKGPWDVGRCICWPNNSQWFGLLAKKKMIL